jgi:hypothetical protein
MKNKTNETERVTRSTTPAPERTECPECIIDGKKVELIGTSFTGHFAGVPF